MQLASTPANSVPTAGTEKNNPEYGDKISMKLLIVEDDRTLNDGIALSLRAEADQILQACTLAEAKSLFTESVDLIILDINLPDGSGLDFCRKIRTASQVPVILLTANDLEVDIVTGLESGADDYITKPFSLMVLRARVHAVLRRKCSDQKTYIQGSFSFHFETMEYQVNGQSVELSKTEQKLLKLLVMNPGQTMSRELLMDRIWGVEAEFVEGNALSVTMKRLREKLPGAPIRTVYGIGYIWEK